jgi:hypothetical protein
MAFTPPDRKKIILTSLTGLADSEKTRWHIWRYDTARRRVVALAVAGMLAEAQCFGDELIGQRVELKIIARALTL